jgi:hypothetical protein
MEQVVERLTDAGWPILEGPALRTGATSKTSSV